MDHHLLAIRVFNRVVETGGFTRAADSLGMPKATVTKLIQNLEDHLQTKLFQRTTRSVSVTREGECYYQNTVKWLADLEQMEGCLTESQNSPQGVLRIDTGSGTARQLLLPALPGFLERYPQIQIDLSIGDRVCMEPGIPDLNSAQTRAGIYNLDPAVRFWATPPVHGCLRETVIHPAAFTFKLPDNVSFAEGAMVEPLAIGMQAATKAGIKPGDIALVIGAGPIGVVTALAALAGGCSDVIICDLFDEKLAVAASYEGLHAVNIKTGDLAGKVAALTSGNGADVVFECSGAKPAIATLAEHAAPGATAVLVGMPIDAAPLDIVAAQAKEITFKTIFRYANMYPRTLRLLSSGKLRVQPLISQTYKFSDSVAAFERAAAGHASDIKIMLEME